MESIIDILHKGGYSCVMKLVPVGDGLHRAEYGRGDVSGDSEFYIKNQGKIATACSLSLIT